MKPKRVEKVYVVRKYVVAVSAQDAIKKERNYPVDDVWLDEEGRKQLSSAIGFSAEQDDYE